MNLSEILKSFFLRYLIRKKLPKGHMGYNSQIHTPSIISRGSLENIFIGNNTTIDWDNTIYANNAKFVFGDYSRAAVGLTVITGNHITKPGEKMTNEDLMGQDVIVEEDVWIGTRVTLLAGAHICRGAIIGAGSVIRTSKVPPYSIVMGNPAKIVGFRYTPDEALEHERVFYPKEKRIPEDVLRNNYSKYFIKRIKDINIFVKL